jgi:hypothetical protein
VRSPTFAALRTGPPAPTRGRRWALDLAFWSVFTVYLAGCLAVLGQSVLALAAARSAPFHDSLHVHALGSGPFARVAARVADAAHSVPSPLQVSLDQVFSLSHLALAALLLWLRPRDWPARLLATALIGAAGVFNLTSQAVVEQLPMTALETFGQTAAHTLAGSAYVYALLLFPDGRAVPRWRPAAVAPLYLAVALAAVALAVRAEGPARPATLLLFFGVLVPLVGAAAQAYRLRTTRDVTEQAQARLVFWALLPAVGFGLYFLATHGLSTTQSGLAGRHLNEPPVALYRSFQPAFALVPLALFAGLLRYRLWDIERLLNRTIVYAVATGLLGGLYLLFVVTVQGIVGSVAATPLLENRITVAVTTLLLASLFRPVRDRVQSFLDRRFHRSRYDAQRTVERFARRLRDEVETDRIVRDLESVLAEVIQPRTTSLWLCGRPAHRGSLDPAGSPHPEATDTSSEHRPREGVAARRLREPVTGGDLRDPIEQDGQLRRREQRREPIADGTCLDADAEPLDVVP